MVCKYCGGELGGIFRRKCNSCGKTQNKNDIHILTDVQNKYTEEVVSVEESSHFLSDNELVEIFNEYFSSNSEFYGQPDSPAYKAYFNAINTATLEMLNNPRLYQQATNRDSTELAAMCSNRIPSITNMLICGLIYSVGKYAVVPSTMLCVDFVSAIPNCAAIYLLLIAQKLPVDSRKQMISTGDGTNNKAFVDVMNSLRICDSNWNYHIF